MHRIPLNRIKEQDVNEGPDKVMKMLRERLKLQSEAVKKEMEMNKRHVNKLNSLKK